jgi:hypothetical protein
MKILALVARHLATHPILSALGTMQPLVTKIDERVQAGVCDQVDTAAIATVTPVGTTLGNEFLATKTRTAVPSVTGFRFDVGFVDKFHTGTSVCG